MLMETGVWAQNSPVGDSFTFLESVAGRTVLVRSSSDPFAFLDSVVVRIVRVGQLNDSFTFLESVAGRTVLVRTPSTQFSFLELPAWSLAYPSGDSCATQLASSHVCHLSGTTGHNAFVIDTCVLVGGLCTLSGNDTVSVIGNGIKDTFNVTDGPGSDVYSLIEGNGNASFYVDGCDGENFTAGVCTSTLLPATDSNEYSAIAGGNALTLNRFYLLSGPGTNDYSLVSAASPGQFTIYTGSGTETYSLIGGTNSTFTIYGGAGNETCVMTGGGNSMFSINPGNGTAEFSLTAGSGSEISINSSMGKTTYNIAF